jgi:hypothetical protein
VTKKHRISIELSFIHRKDFLALKNSVSSALCKARGTVSFRPLRKLLDTIEEQAEAQNWEDLERTYPEDDRRKEELTEGS